MGLLVACVIGSYSLYDIPDERKKYETKINLIPYHENNSSFTDNYFCNLWKCQCCTCKNSCKTCKKHYKNNQKSSCPKPLKRIPAKSASSMSRNFQRLGNTFFSKKSHEARNLLKLRAFFVVSAFKFPTNGYLIYIP